MNRRHLIEQREDRHAIHYGGLKQKSLPARRRQIAQFAVGIDDRSFIRCDGMGSPLDRGTNMIDRRLAIGDIEGSSFE